jgi:hypothetical protein
MLTRKYACGSIGQSWVLLKQMMYFFKLSALAEAGGTSEEIRY